MLLWAFLFQIRCVLREAASRPSSCSPCDAVGFWSHATTLRRNDGIVRGVVAWGNLRYAFVSFVGFYGSKKFYLCQGKMGCLWMAFCAICRKSETLSCPTKLVAKKTRKNGQLGIKRITRDQRTPAGARLSKTNHKKPKKHADAGARFHLIGIRLRPFPYINHCENKKNLKKSTYFYLGIVLYRAAVSLSGC